MHGSGVELGFLGILTNHKMVDDDGNDDGVASGGTNGGGRGHRVKCCCGDQG